MRSVMISRRALLASGGLALSQISVASLPSKAFIGKAIWPSKLSRQGFVLSPPYLVRNGFDIRSALEAEQSAWQANRYAVNDGKLQQIGLPDQREQISESSAVKNYLKAIGGAPVITWSFDDAPSIYDTVNSSLPPSEARMLL